jgi:hypothetical protein
MTEPRCQWCHRTPPHPVRNTTNRRHGTYITAAFEMHKGHTLTIKQGLASVNLFCIDCDRNVIEAAGGRWTGEYESAACLMPGYKP